MDLKNFVQEDYKNYLDENNLTVFGGNSNRSMLRNILDDFCELLTGFKEPLIDITTDHYTNDDVYIFEHKLKNGGEYQHNYFHVSKSTYKLVKVDGDGKKILQKIFNFIEYFDVEKFVKWQSTISMMGSIAYYMKCDSERADANYIKFGEKTLEKWLKLNKIHQKLSSLSNEEIDKILDVMLETWEEYRFERGAFLNQHFKGSFSNFDIPNINNLKGVKVEEPIIFPGDSRGEICSQYLVTNDMEDILKKAEGDIIKLKNTRKCSKIKKYTVLEHNVDILEKNIDDCHVATALKSEKGEIKFITSLGEAEECWDALFDCNKREFNDWKKNKVKLVK